MKVYSMNDGELNTNENILNDSTSNVSETPVVSGTASKVEQYLGQKSVLEIVFGGAKRFIIIAMTLALLASYFSGVQIPESTTNLFLGIIGLYFGVGAIAVGGKIAK